MNLMQRFVAALELILDRDTTDPEFTPLGESDGSWLAGHDAAAARRFGAVPAAYAAVNLLSAELATLPIEVRRRDQVVEDHPLADLLAWPSAMMDPWQLWEFVYRALMAGGNSYCDVVRLRGRPVELVPAVAIRAEYQSGTRGSRPAYDLELLGDDGRGRRDRVTRFGRDIVSLHGPGFDGLVSPSPISYAARNTLAMVHKVMTHQYSILDKGVAAGVALTQATEVAKGRLSPEQIMELIERLQDGFSGARNAGKVPVLPPGMDVARMGSLSAVDLQLVDILKWSVEDIARVYNVSPIRLGHYHEGFRVSTFEAQASDFERYTIYPLALRVGAQLNHTLLTEADVRDGYTIALDSDMLALGSLSERIKAADQAVAKAGIWTVNEGRRLTGRPDRTDGDRLMSPKGAPAQPPATDDGNTRDDDNDEGMNDGS